LFDHLCSSGYSIALDDSAVDFDGKTGFGGGIKPAPAMLERLGYSAGPEGVV
jgi:hypothetical protein